MILSLKRNNNNGKTWLVLPESQDSFPNWRHGTPKKIQMFFGFIYFVKRNKKKIREQNLVLLLSLFIFLQYQWMKAARFVEKCKTFQTKNVTLMWQIFATNVCILSRAGKPAYFVLKMVLLL